MAVETREQAPSRERQPVGAARTDGYLPIGGYAVIGDGASVCLVGSDGGLDWMCAPHIDSEPVFDALLDAGSGGRMTLAPEGEFSTERRYVPGTNVLETTFVTEEGTLQVRDAVAIGNGRTALASELIRRIEGLSGEVRLRWRFAPGAAARGFEIRREGARLLARRGNLQLALQSWGAGEPAVEGGVAEASVPIRAGDTALLVMQVAEDQTLTLTSRESAERRLLETCEVWRAIVAGHSYEGAWREAVERSLLAILLLSDVRSGAIAAAATTSLPEVLRGQRNYDYRYAWVRDVSFTLDALLAIGVEQPTGDALSWLLHATRRTHPRVDPIYTLSGEVLRTQHDAPVPGYRNTSPAHVGNQAGSQLQLGGFGDLLEAIWNYTNQGHLLPVTAGERLADMGDLLCKIWRRPDAGLWELDERADYASSKIGCWTAFNRLVDLARAGRVPDRGVERWRRERDAVREFIDARLFSEQKGSYLMKAGSQALDCATLLAARRGFIDGDDPRLQGTIDAIRRELGAGGPLLYRYSGMREQENAFLACSFWMVEALVIAGRRAEAASMFEDLLGLGNDVGLYSEELQPQTGELRGNFPQALTHLSLIRAAVAVEAPSTLRST